MLIIFIFSSNNYYCDYCDYFISKGEPITVMAHTVCLYFITHCLIAVINMSPRILVTTQRCPVVLTLENLCYSPSWKWVWFIGVCIPCDT